MSCTLLFSLLPHPIRRHYLFLIYLLFKVYITWNNNLESEREIISVKFWIGCATMRERSYTASVLGCQWEWSNCAIKFALQESEKHLCNMLATRDKHFDFFMKGDFSTRDSMCWEFYDFFFYLPLVILLKYKNLIYISFGPSFLTKFNSNMLLKSATVHNITNSFSFLSNARYNLYS